MLKFNKVCISGMTGISDKVLNSYKEKIESLYPGSRVDILSKNILTENEAIELMQNYDVLMSGYQTMTDRIYEKTSLAAFITCSIGFDFANVEAATNHNVIVANNPQYCITEVAEHSIALILACARNIVKMSNAVSEGKWGFPVIAPQYRFEKSTVGLFGFGRIPRMLAERLLGLGVKIIAYDPYVTQEMVSESGVTMVDFDELLKESDYISLHAPLTKDTREIFNKEAFNKMKSGSCIINTARGQLINQDDLYNSLLDGKIRVAALDVLKNEPPTEKEQKLIELPNVICTGHTGFYSEESLLDQTDLTVENIGRVLKGELPENIINKEVLKNINWNK